MGLREYEVLGAPEDAAPVLRALKKRLWFRHNPKIPDFYLVVGGDGVILDREIKAKVLGGNGVPVLRVHHRPGSVKTLGYMADVSMRNLKNALDDVEKGRYVLEGEPLLDCTINGGLRDTAVNDIAVRPRKVYASMLCQVEARLGRYSELLPAPKCTGLVISERYGSTAWNLAVGGPINIGVDCIQVNVESGPLKQEHYILLPTSKLLIKVFIDSVVAVDRAEYKVDSGGRFEVTRSRKTAVFIRTESTRESLMDKVRRQNAFSLSRVEEK